MQNFTNLFSGYLTSITLPDIGINDIIEILLLSCFTYQFMVWIKTTRAYSLLKGILTILAFLMLAYIFRLNTILFIFQHLANVLIIGVIVIFQPELRKVLEELGRKQIFSTLFSLDAAMEVEERFADKTVNEIVKACFDMAAVKTGALLVIEQDVTLSEYERTGIRIDAVITSQLIINIFEHNTPLHDGAVLVRGNRIVAATCYLPLSDNMELSKQLGTRHRAAVGISEVSDSLTVIVSEETGNVSVAREGKLMRCLEPEDLRRELRSAQNKKVIESGRFMGLLRGRGRHAKDEMDG